MSKVFRAVRTKFQSLAAPVASAQGSERASEDTRDAGRGIPTWVETIFESESEEGSGVFCCCDRHF